MLREEIEDWLRKTIVEQQEGISTEQVVPSASLFQDLGFDSLAFERLLATLESTGFARDLSGWYFRAARHGEDTIGSLIDFLVGSE
jgi:hypothetical protein